MPNSLDQDKPTAAEPRIDIWLWTGFLLSPLAMGLNTIVGYTVAHWTADTGHKHLSYLVSAIDFVLCLSALTISLSAYRRFHAAQEDVPLDGRRLFMAKISLLLSLMAILVVVAGTLAVVTLHPFD